MRYASIPKTFRIEATHHLPDHSQCARLYGHSYQLEVRLHGLIKDTQCESHHGMIMDFSDLSSIVKNVIAEVLDHQDLNVATVCIPRQRTLCTGMLDVR